MDVHVNSRAESRKVVQSPFGLRTLRFRSEKGRDIGVVMQNVAVFDELKVYENVDCICGLYVPDAKKRSPSVDEVIKFVGLGEFREFYPRKLSGGLLRCLNIACDIDNKPRLLILDELTVAVESQSRNRILEGIRDLNRQGSTVVYISHYMEEVEQLCTWIVHYGQGQDLSYRNI